MGHLDEKKYVAAITGCKKCDAKAFEVNTYIDREVLVMLAQPSGDGRWTVKTGGSSTPTSTHHKQSTAIQKAEKIAVEKKTELIIRGRDGTIRSKDSYGNDPNPPKDTEH